MKMKLKTLAFVSVLCLSLLAELSIGAVTACADDKADAEFIDLANEAIDRKMEANKAHIEASGSGEMSSLQVTGTFILGGMSLLSFAAWVNGLEKAATVIGKAPDLDGIVFFLPLELLDPKSVPTAMNQADGGEPKHVDPGPSFDDTHSRSSGNTPAGQIAI